jgi:hypothetical protein
MTEYEAVELGQIYFANFISSFGVFLTVVTAYLIVAYTIGSSLKPSQVSIINGIFLATTLFMTYGNFAYISAGSYYAVLGASMNPERHVFAGHLPGYVSLVISICVIVACLKFMWDIRHRKKR